VENQSVPYCMQSEMSEAFSCSGALLSSQRKGSS